MSLKRTSKSTNMYIPAWTMPAGKYQGRTLAEIAETDMAYLRWAAEWANASSIRGRVQCYLGRQDMNA